MNSDHPFRIEGQKTIMYRVLRPAAGSPPMDVVPGGNLEIKRLAASLHRADTPRHERTASIAWP